MELKVKAKQCPECPCIMDILRERGYYEKCRMIIDNCIEHAGDSKRGTVVLECVGCGYSEEIKGVKTIVDLEVK